MPAVSSSRYMVTVGWDDVPHLSEETKRELYESTPPHLREARSKGIPSIGSGAILPVADEDIRVAPFAIPKFYKRCFAMDVGWNRTAALWAATDPDTDTTYFHAEHYRGQAEPAVHAAAIKARGAWIPGVIDPAARGRSQRDGKRLIDEYRDLGLDLEESDNAVEAGLHLLWEGLATGKIKVFSNLSNFFAEKRLYRRDEKGKVVKENDHLMDPARYIMLSGLARAITRPVKTNVRGSSHITGDKRAGY